MGELAGLGSVAVAVGVGFELVTPGQNKKSPQPTPPTFGPGHPETPKYLQYPQHQPSLSDGKQALELLQQLKLELSEE